MAARPAPDPAPASKPEERELAKKLASAAALENKLIERELALATLKFELASFEQRYLQFVGARYAELDELLAQIAETKALKKSHDFRAQENAQQARIQAQESAKTSATDAAAAASAGASRPAKVPDEMKRLYRETAQQMHPDLPTVPKERARSAKHWTQANLDFAAGDQAKLEAHVRSFTPNSEAVPGEAPSAVLQRTNRKIAQLEARLLAITEAMADVKIQMLYKVFQKVEKAAAAGRDLLVEMNWEIVMKISDAREELATLNGTRKD